MKIRFCKKCSNMLYIHSTDDANNLKYYCKNCEYTEIDKNPNGCIYENIYNTNYLTYDIIFNKYTRHDPTLPRIKTMKCINEKCVSNMEYKGVLILSDMTIHEGRIDIVAKLNEILAGVKHKYIDIDTESALIDIEDKSLVQDIKGRIEKVHPYVEYHDNLDPMIIFIKYDPENLKYVYVCDYCNTSWKNK